MERVEAVVVGAGVVGLAVARALARRGIETLVIEAQPAIGTGISSRNSEVIHAGLYYPPGSLKARLCVTGKRQLYAFCESHGVAHRRCGKLLVATEAAQWPGLQALQAQAAANGVDDLVLLDAAQARAMEPALTCLAALWSPSTGIVDSHGLMLALQGDLEGHGGMVALASPVRALQARRDGHVVEVGGQQPMELSARIVVNAAGLWAPELARASSGLATDGQPHARFCKGNYFSLAGRAPFSRLIYPLPNHAGLGVHLTLDLGGQARFGPDTQWLPDDTRPPIDYTVDPARGDGFYAEVRRYWPALPDGALQPAYSGVRPKLVGPGEPAADFRIDGPAQHGVPGLVNLFGIESPGLTASLALADDVLSRLGA
ncbi:MULTISPECIES: NAD(P)/FAD-dependent oxidoreductase [unclassified Rhizobacter]|uniref:NAD(P)/FAD-dependent oxidoreductase n=1 Tax=unclassified Rhizobacter TaxID=2640088 RepID=UPI0006F95347|nr:MULTISPECIES: NAD(P)/FAD-dependent oxidoreductase [unclassified Rhizobacter]KQU79014.1 FAD-dependent oxidoreductase [Rhizobacter sp. Root29]KQW13509.1 FAD-dependent oxidoreductase [Rhizobacter sp. Root1238]KRB06281.1 FAD-dependent oxidoreductase [Rhizobacter sp. Root16D2]